MGATEPFLGATVDWEAHEGPGRASASIVTGRACQASFSLLLSISEEAVLKFTSGPLAVQFPQPLPPSTPQPSPAHYTPAHALTWDHSLGILQAPKLAVAALCCVCPLSAFSFAMVTGSSCLLVHCPITLHSPLEKKLYHSPWGLPWMASEA